jgi:hypothetical protein
MQTKVVHSKVLPCYTVVHHQDTKRHANASRHGHSARESAKRVPSLFTLHVRDAYARAPAMSRSRRVSRSSRLLQPRLIDVCTFH